MTYQTSNPPRPETWSSDGAKPTTWTYASEHTMRDLAATAFFTDATNLGMRVEDIIFAQQNVEPFDSATFTVFDITDGEATLSRSRVSPFLETDWVENNVVTLAPDGNYQVSEIVFEEQTLDADLISETLAYYTGVDATNWPDDSEGWVGQAMKIASGAEEGNLGVIALDTLDGRIATRVKNSVWGNWTYIEKEISVDDFGAVSYLTQGLAEAGTDSAPAFQAAVDYCVDNNISARIKIGPNAYRLASTITVPKSSMFFAGAGMLETTLMIDHISGAGLRFTRDNPMLEDLAIIGSTTRRALSYDASMPGVQCEPEDAVDTTAMRLRWAWLKNVSVRFHPGSGITGVGAFTGQANECVVSDNKGHGYHVATDITARVNATGVPGLFEATGGQLGNNGGHAFCTAPLTSVASPAVRIGLNNVEILGNALDAAVRLYTSELYFRGAQVEVTRCIMQPNVGNTTIEGFYFSGIGGRFINNRYIRCLRAGTISSHDTLQTDLVTVDATHMITHPGNYNPLLLIRTEGTLTPRQIRMGDHSGGTVTAVIGVDGTIPTGIDAQWTVHGAFADDVFSLVDNTDATKKLALQLSGITTGTTITLTVPNASGTLATLGGTAQTFTNTMTVFANFSGGTLTGTTTCALGSGATTTGITKTVNVGTAGLSGSTTNITLGSSVAGAAGTIVNNFPPQDPGYTVATLPAATTRCRAFVSDSNATLAAGLGNIVAAGGANLVPVYADGTNWRIG